MYRLLAEFLPEDATQCSIKKVVKKFFGVEIPPMCQWNPWFHRLIGPAMRAQAWAARKAAQV